MSDDKMPYEEAITESAKAASNAVDLAREAGRAVSPALGNIYGLLLGDRVGAWRERNQDKLARATKRIFEERNVKEPQAPPESITIPLLEAAQGEPRAEMQELWARLLANAMDPARADDVRPEFVDTLKKLQPIDAFILAEMGKESKGFSDGELIGLSKRRQSAALVSLDHLKGLKCLQQSPSNGYYSLTSYGHELVAALKP